LEHPHQSALENHDRRTPRLGRRRSVNLSIGIKPEPKAKFSLINIDHITMQTDAAYQSYAAK